MKFMLIDKAFHENRPFSTIPGPFSPHRTSNQQKPVIPEVLIEIPGTEGNHIVDLFILNQILNFIIMLKFHVDGGMQWMAPLSILLILNICLAIFVFTKWSTKGIAHERGVRLVREIGIFALAFGVLGTIEALYFAFGSLSEMEQQLPLNVIMGGLKVAMITAIYGLIVFLVSLAMFLVLRFAIKGPAS